MGFYESILFRSDTEYYINQNLCDDNNIEYEIDFEPYQIEVGKAVCELLEQYTSGGLIHDIKFISIVSPKYYNFDTDRINAEIEYNYFELKKYLNDNKDDFNLYLNDNFTSYDGFMSFIANNYDEFISELNTGHYTYINTALEYYILRHIYNAKWEEMKNLRYAYDTNYHSQLFEINNELQYAYLKEVEVTAE